VIASKSSLEPLNEALDDRTLDEYRAILISKRKKINAELENVPVRIDEARRQLPEISETREAIQVRIDELTLDRIAKREEYSRIESGSQVAEIKKQIAEIDAEILALRNQATQSLIEVDRERRSKIGDLESRADDAKRAVTRIELEIKDAEHRLENLKKRHAEASAKHKQIREQSFSPKPFAESCAACGQSLPSEQIESARKHALEEWNLEQSKKLEQIVSDGRQVRVEIDSTQQHVDSLKAKLEEARTISAQASDALVEAKATLTHCIEVAADPRIKELEDRKQSKKIDLENLSLCDHEAKEQIKAQISKLDELLAEQQQKIAKHEQEAKLKTRIEELLAEEKKLVQEIEKIDHQLFLSDEFIRTKVSMLEHRINSKFELVGFKLFDQQVNGAIAETCICTVNGVPYDGALNHGSRINAGLDVIRTLQSHYGFFPPVIIDGAESTTRFLSMPCQLVKLYVSEQDKALRIETSQP
jgi:chromosome segregation ATPase